MAAKKTKKKTEEGFKKFKPGRSVTKKVTKGPNKGDTVQFRANAPGTKFPGKLSPRRVIKDAGPKNTSLVPKGKKPAAKKKKAKKK